MRVRLAKRALTNSSVLMNVGMHLLTTAGGVVGVEHKLVDNSIDPILDPLLTVSTGDVVGSTLLFCYQPGQLLEGKEAVSTQH